MTTNDNDETNATLAEDALDAIADNLHAEEPEVEGFAWYVKLDGVDGESMDAGHDRWMDVLSVGQAVNKPAGGQIVGIGVGELRPPKA